VRLGDLYVDLAEAVPPFALHLGGDEVVVGSETSWARCWNSSRAQPVLDLLAAKGLDRRDPRSFYALWAEFTQAAVGLALQAGYGTLVQWAGGRRPDEVVYGLVERPEAAQALPPGTVDLMVWDTLEDSIAPMLAKRGYGLILAHSDKTYLDCGAPGWVRPGGYWCQPYLEWQTIYEYVAAAKRRFSAAGWAKVKGAQATPTQKK
jgi:hypothetical protein